MNSRFSNFIKVPLVASFVLASSVSLAQKNKVDSNPSPPRPGAPETDISQQAGIGGGIPYARAGVLELGGSASYSAADKVSILSIAPSAGYFFADNWELTATMQWMHSKVSGGDSADIFMLLAEPSFNYPVTDTQFAFGGLGLGFAKSSGSSFGTAIAPRIGYKLLIGRSGVLTADIRDTIFSRETAGQSNTVALGVGYTILW